MDPAKPQWDGCCGGEREREREQGSSPKHARKLEQQVWEKWVGVAFFFAMYPQDYDWVVQAMLDWCFLGNVVAFCVIVTNDRYSWNTYAEPVSKITNTEQDRVFIQKKKKNCPAVIFGPLDNKSK